MSTKKLFRYTEIEGDPTKEEIQEKEKFYGYGPTKPLEYDDTYMDLYNSIIHDKSIMSAERVPVRNVDEKRLRESVSIWSDLGIKLYEIDMLDRAYGNVASGNFTLTQEFLDAIRDAHPSELPITFHRGEGGKFYGHVERMCMKSASRPEDNALLYSCILLPRLGNKITPCIYNHEITHTQLDSGDCCQNLLDSETIPTIIEEIFASKIDPSGNTLERIRNVRLLSIVRLLTDYLNIPDMDYVNRIESDTCIKSTLQATKIANIWLTSKPSIRNEIQGYIDRIFREEASVQDMLNQYEANLDEIPKSLRYLKTPKINR